jgi:hypothetical protein
MEVLYPNCAGLDVRKNSVVACSRRMAGSKVEREVRTFATTTSELLALSEWLSSLGATHIAMEATGVYWRPVWNILSDGEFELILANAQHVKNVPGRKTDVNDATPSRGTWAMNRRVSGSMEKIIDRLHHQPSPAISPLSGGAHGCM